MNRRSARLARQLVAQLPKQTKEICKRLTPNDRVVAVSRLFDPSLVDVSKQDKGGWEKPRGLWYGCGREWLDYCEDNVHGKGEQEYVYALTLDFSKMIVVKDAQTIQSFHEKYKAPPAGTWGAAVYHIDWQKVAQDYSGIEICPYNDFGRTHLRAWYRNWDVASGCVWDSAALQNVQLLASPTGVDFGGVGQE